jgi:hypothetical protein
VIVELTWGEVRQAAIVAVLRQVANLEAGRKDAHGGEAGDGWGKHVEGCCSELAAAKGLGLYWSGSLGVLRAPDVGGRVQVRGSQHAGARLIIRDDDADDAIFVLVVGRLPKYQILGWIRAGDAKRQEYRGDPTDTDREPAFFVPRAALRQINRSTQEVGR